MLVADLSYMDCREDYEYSQLMDTLAPLTNKWTYRRKEYEYS